MLDLLDGRALVSIAGLRMGLGSKRVSCGVRAGGSTERDAIGYSVSSQPVAAVNAAGAFSAREQAFNRRSGRGERSGIHVDADAAHSVMDGGHLAAGVPRPFGQLLVGGVCRLESEGILGFSGHCFVIAVDGLLQFDCVHLGLAGQVFNGFPFDDVAEGEHVLDGCPVRIRLRFRRISNFVNDDPVRGIGLRKDGLAQGVALGSFVDETFAVFVHENAIAS